MSSLAASPDNSNNSTQLPAPSLAAKALLARKHPKQNPTYVSPTDNLLTPCSQKLNAAKKKQFSNAAKPVQLFASQPAVQKDSTPLSDGSKDAKDAKGGASEMEVDDENPF